MDRKRKRRRELNWNWLYSFPPLLLSLGRTVQSMSSRISTGLQRRRSSSSSTSPLRPPSINQPRQWSDYQAINIRDKVHNLLTIKKTKPRDKIKREKPTVRKTRLNNPNSQGKAPKEEPQLFLASGTGLQRCEKKPFSFFCFACFSFPWVEETLNWDILPGHLEAPKSNLVASLWMAQANARFNWFASSCAPRIFSVVEMQRQASVPCSLSHLFLLWAQVWFWGCMHLPFFNCRVRWLLSGHIIVKGLFCSVCMSCCTQICCFSVWLFVYHPSLFLRATDAIIIIVIPPPAPLLVIHSIIYCTQFSWPFLLSSPPVAPPSSSSFSFSSSPSLGSYPQFYFTFFPPID